MAAEQATAIKCLEVWGGVEAVDTVVSLPGIEAYVHSQPHEGAAQGGDVYYLSSCFSGRVGRIVLADVSGHGQGVSSVALQLRKLMRKHINNLDQSGLARVLNTEFAQADHNRFATAVLLSYFSPTDQLILCNAGHPRPLWYRARLGQWLLLDHEQAADEPTGPNNLPLGMIDPTHYVQFMVQLEPGDFVVLYTDWLLEAMNPLGQMLGEQGVLNLVSHCDRSSPRALGQDILRLGSEYRGLAAADDDQTLVVLHHNAQNAPSQPVREAVRYVAGLLGLAGD